MKLSCQFLNKVSKIKDPEVFWFHLLKSLVSSPSCNMHLRYNASRNIQITPTQVSAHALPSCFFQIHHIIRPHIPYVSQAVSRIQFHHRSPVCIPPSFTGIMLNTAHILMPIPQV